MIIRIEDAPKIASFKLDIQFDEAGEMQTKFDIQNLDKEETTENVKTFSSDEPLDFDDDMTHVSQETVQLPEIPSTDINSRGANVSDDMDDAQF